MLEVVNLVAGYAGHRLPTIWNFSVKEGEMVLLAGVNGSGKSTLLKTLAGLVPSLSGSFSAGDIQFVPTRIPKVKGFTVREFVAIGTSSWRLGRRIAVRDNDSTDRALEMMGIESIASRDISSLSDGEFQKACVASALARRPSVLMLDEPSSYLDVEGRLALLKLLRSIADDGCAVLFSSHDVADSLPVVDRVIGIGPDGAQLVSEKTEDSKARTICGIFNKLSLYLKV